MKTEKYKSLQERRKELILRLDSASSDDIEKEISEELFSLDLTVYSKKNSFDSTIYSAFAQSILDNDVVLHPEQLDIVDLINKNKALIVSAPTSFGKTFCIFEYIARFKPKNIVLVVPTLALVEEYIKRIIKKYSEEVFYKYKVHTQVDIELNYDFTLNNIFILTHDRIVQEGVYENIEKIDFLVIDEVYKLETDVKNDRVLVLNMAYYHLAMKAKKYVLLAPFIECIEDINSLDKVPYFYKTNYSPVVNEVDVVPVWSHEQRYEMCAELLKNKIKKSDKTLVYFPTVYNISDFINKKLIDEPIIENHDEYVSSFLSWAKNEIHDKWSIVTAVERGYLVHNGQIPLSVRIFLLNLFENNNIYNRLFCTSTLLEGVNTVAKNIVIVKPSPFSFANNNDSDFTSFDFFNLVGRTGRLYRHYIGKAFYIKTPDDPDYKIADAVKNIKFEITDDTLDIKIHTDKFENSDEYLTFLKNVGITHEEYKINIGTSLRFNSVVDLYNSLISELDNLKSELLNHYNNTRTGRYNLILKLYLIIENNNRNAKFNCSIINDLLHKNRKRIKDVVNNVIKHYKRPIDSIISQVIKMKFSYIEHDFYKKVKIIKFFLSSLEIDDSLISILQDKVLNNIEFLYFSSSKHKRMLLDVGIDDYDLEHITDIIGTDYEDVFEMKRLLKNNANEFRKIGFMSKYIINRL